MGNIGQRNVEQLYLNQNIIKERINSLEQIQLDGRIRKNIVFTTIINLSLTSL